MRMGGWTAASEAAVAANVEAPAKVIGDAERAEPQQDQASEAQNVILAEVQQARGSRSGISPCIDEVDGIRAIKV